MAAFQDPFQDIFNKHQQRLNNLYSEYNKRNFLGGLQTSLSGIESELSSVNDALKDRVIKSFQMFVDKADELKETLHEMSLEDVGDMDKAFIRMEKNIRSLRSAAESLRAHGLFDKAEQVEGRIIEAEQVRDLARRFEIEKRILELKKSAKATFLGMDEEEFIRRKNELKEMASSFRGIMLQTATLFGVELRKQLAASFEYTRNRGFGLSQLIQSSIRGFSTQFRNLLQGRFISNQQAIETTLGIGERLGGRPSNRAVDQALKLQELYKLSADEAATLEASLYRMSGFSEETTRQITRSTAELAKQADLSPGDLLREMANSAELMALYIGKSPDAFARATIHARQLGLSLKAADSFANSLTDDFESSLQKQAQLQTMFPGLDLTEIQYASQFGTPEQVAQLLSQQVRGLGYQNINQIPRSLRNALASGLGMTQEELQNAMQGKAPVTEAGQLRTTTTEETKTTQLLTGLADFVGANGIATAALIALGLAATKAAAGMLFSGARGLFGGSAAAGAGAAAAGAAGIGGSALKFGGRLLRGGLLGSLIGFGGNYLGDRIGGAGGQRLSDISTYAGIGTGVGSLLGPLGMIGGGILGAGAGFIRNQFRNPQSPRVTTVETPPIGTSIDPIVVDTTSLEAKMDLLIRAIHSNQPIIYLDGVKVGSVIHSSNARQTPLYNTR